MSFITSGKGSFKRVDNFVFCARVSLKVLFQCYIAGRPLVHVIFIVGAKSIHHLVYSLIHPRVLLMKVGNILCSGLDFSDDNLDREILFEVLRCVINVSQQLGKASSAIFYESLLSAPSISSEEVLPRLLKILETGYSSSVTSLHIFELGADIAWEKEVADHKKSEEVLY
ncbi:hypothetical protein Acr_09g0008120 [Actinidia rufa]|uniref:NUP160 helical domain-containing protein n=1 Tax=Actinidia rufa TaxID=165716 RepID=A0A7J0F7F5_9ERIC|nr:hypothetical protein Acr_09g0008120 [Actinidia rufa]